VQVKCLVVGGAGYIGSHMLKMLCAAGHEVTAFDNLSTGFRDAARYGRFVLGDIADRPALESLFRESRFDAVLHFASFISVGESVKEPAKYYRNNVCNTQNLLDAMVAHGTRRFVFSSTAAVYGEPRYSPIDEDHPRQPINPYGRSKLMVEQMLADYDLAYGIRSVCLRYFNAAGADPEGELGERHEPETHLIPLVLQAASGRRASVSLYGTDYETPDGTCVRDYIHVEDLCQAHVLALDRLVQGKPSTAYNLGNGEGYSVREVLRVVREVTGREFEVVERARRGGDAARLVADSRMARSQLGWTPRHGALKKIVEDAWRWENSRGISVP